MKDKKILVLGSTGMLGHVVYLHLKKTGHFVYGLSNENIDGLTDAQIDAQDYSSIFDYIKANRIQVVINCIGLLNKDCDNNQSLSFYLNSILPHLIGEYCFANDIYFIHMSTDYVFSGKKKEYTEYDIPDQIEGSMYSLSKIYGEVCFLTNCLTIRTSIIGPDYSSSNKGLFNMALTSRSDLTGFTNVFWNGVTTLEFAKQIEKLLTLPKYGVVHMVSEKNFISKHDLIENILNLKNNKNTLFKNSDRKLAINLIDSKGIFNIPSINNMLSDVKEWILNNPKLYQSLLKEIK